MGIGSFLKTRRHQFGLSLRKVADLVQIDVAYLSRVEAEKNPPSSAILSRLSEALRIPEQELMLMAGRVPSEIAEKVSNDPTAGARALSALTAALEDSDASIIVEGGESAIERDFPFEQISRVAEAESWRKEIYRPVYHIHKWWAQRLGSVFRAILIGALAPAGSNIAELMYQPVRFPGRVVFDPFMGSGTTVGEAVKLGCKAIGRDINPVAWRAVRTALRKLNRKSIETAFERLEQQVGSEIAKMYVGLDSQGKPCRVLYYFWVKTSTCPRCQRAIDFFSSYIFARHAYAQRSPAVRVLCKECGHVLTADYREKTVKCEKCHHVFDPHIGPVKGGKITCQGCGASLAIVNLARHQGSPFDHRMYAKLVLKDDGSKEYLPATEFDRELYSKACRKYDLKQPAVPEVPIMDGYNTRQIINYSYRSWHELFNKRQLLCLSLLGEAVSRIEDTATREAFLMLFSSTLEFNNMFVSYKGEGTGAVRHMFSHHILKPERVPIEPNIWGTVKSSGAFSTLYRSRLLRALDYKDMPFELKVDNGTGKRTSKIVGLTEDLHVTMVDSFDKLVGPKTAWISCGSSVHTDLPDKSVDAIITDPPFFDNVHYSELADFFYVWQQIYSPEKMDQLSTRHEEEVQDVDADSFARKLAEVFEECHRVLKDRGLMAFTYHHSRRSGWKAVASAVSEAEFRIVASHPVKSEMSVAQPKLQAKEPIDIDTILVCRKRRKMRPQPPLDTILGAAYKRAIEQVSRFNKVGKTLSRNDVKVIFLSNVLTKLSGTQGEARTMAGVLDSSHTRYFYESLFVDQAPVDVKSLQTDHVSAQLNLF